MENTKIAVIVVAVLLSVTLILNLIIMVILYSADHSCSMEPSICPPQIQLCSPCASQDALNPVTDILTKSVLPILLQNSDQTQSLLNRPGLCTPTP